MASVSNSSMLILCLTEGDSKKQLTRDDADTFRRRWEHVNAAETEEIQGIKLA